MVGAGNLPLTLLLYLLFQSSLELAFENRRINHLAVLLTLEYLIELLKRLPLSLNPAEPDEDNQKHIPRRIHHIHLPPHGIKGKRNGEDENETDRVHGKDGDAHAVSAQGIVENLRRIEVAERRPAERVRTHEEEDESNCSVYASGVAGSAVDLGEGADQVEKNGQGDSRDKSVEAAPNSAGEICPRKGAD